MAIKDNFCFPCIQCLVLKKSAQQHVLMFLFIRFLWLCIMLETKANFSIANI